MKIRCVWEHNGNDTLLYAVDYTGAFTRGASLEEAVQKMPSEIRSYCLWAGAEMPGNAEISIIQEQASPLMIRDADSDVLFDLEREPMAPEEYERQKLLAIKSAQDFQCLYDSVPDHSQSCLKPRKTFYHQIPRTAQEMYTHTRDVNSYYFGEIGAEADHSGGIAECRMRGFAALEAISDFLCRPVAEGSYGELWSVRKVLRRFLWHDRIHAKAMWRMAQKTFPEAELANPFRFE